GGVLLLAGRAGEAEVYLQQALVIQEKRGPAWLVGATRSELGGAVSAQHRYKEAEPLLLDGYDLLRKSRGEEHARTVAARAGVAANYEAWGKPEQAARYRTAPAGAPGIKP